MKRYDRALQQALDAIVRDRERNETEKLAAAFEAITASFIAQSRREVELARALGDEDTAVQEQIKAGVMLQARAIFAEAYARATGTRAVLWDE